MAQFEVISDLSPAYQQPDGLFDVFSAHYKLCTHQPGRPTRFFRLYLRSNEHGRHAHVVSLNTSEDCDIQPGAERKYNIRFEAAQRLKPSGVARTVLDAPSGFSILSESRRCGVFPNIVSNTR